MDNSISSGLEPYDGPWEVPEVKHFLKRTMFGAKPNDINYFQNRSFQQSLQEVIRINNNSVGAPINTYSEKEIDPDVAYGATWVNAPFSNRFKFDRMWTSIHWWTNRLIHQDRSITEKMILFWHNHFGVANTGSQDPRTNYRYINTLHVNALGNFKKMIKDITVDPLMLNFLNGFQNEARAPDENYARELMELFTLGKGPESKYTEEDVKAAARVLTGFQFDYNRGSADFFSSRHDIGDKTFSSFFGNKTIKAFGGNEDWPTEIFGMIDMIFEKEEVSKFLCRKFYRFFVNYDITDEIEQQVILPLAQIFRNNNYEILPVMNALFGSKHFFDSENTGSMIKSPIDFYIGMIREMEPDLPSDMRIYSYFMEDSRKLLFYLQQHLPDPPNVAGWPAYYQNPIYGRSWINSETLKTRASYVEAFLDKNAKPRYTSVILDLIKYAGKIEGVEDPNQLINKVLERMFSLKPSQEYKNHLKKILLSNQENDYYWTNAWLDYKSKPDDENYKNIVEIRLRQFFKSIMHIEEYNLH
ncbi:MAG: DUF1800 domain-containing protein [Bacteroidota bacterium]